MFAKIFAMLFAALLSFSSSAQIFPEDKKKEGSLVILEYITVSQENTTCKKIIKKAKKAPKMTEEECNSLVASLRKKVKKLLHGDRLVYIFSKDSNGWTFEPREEQG